MLLRDEQYEALQKMHNGCVLCGGVGSGKTRTSFAYYWTTCGGQISPKLVPPVRFIPLVVITTAHARDLNQWWTEMATFGVSKDNANITVDSWNNIQKYKELKDCFFIFDEQRACGGGVWSKTFIKIAKSNLWIMASATPGDTWNDYGPLFVANGYFKNITEFRDEHIKYSRFGGNYPRITGYLGVAKLNRLKSEIIVNMYVERTTTRCIKKVVVSYDRERYRFIQSNRCDPDTGIPYKNVSEFCAALRRCVNSNPERAEVCLTIANEAGKVIIFYNFDYELEQLLKKFEGEGFDVAQWNGHKHQPIPKTERWVYLCQYLSGAEAWNCIETDTMIFYSQTYSYKGLCQASGRIDRLNTPYTDLFYYHIRSMAPLDLAIAKALHNKKDFNESDYSKK